MDGIHDLGGLEGFGPVDAPPSEPVFGEAWERRAFRTSMAAMIGLQPGGAFRHSIERMDPAHYLGSSYFEHWLDGIARVLMEKGVVDAADLDARTRLFQERPDAPLGAPPAGPAAGAGRRVLTSFRTPVAPPRFAIGSAVTTRTMHPAGHTRLPRYARGKRGAIARFHGVHVFPDTNAHGRGEDPQPLYSVSFDARELWGESAEANQRVHIDLWESYLEPGE